MAAEKILARGVTELLKTLTSVVSGQINEAWGARGDLKKLKGTLETIAAVTTDAEEQQIKSKLVQLWLERLNDVVYDADDVLDEFSYEAMRQMEQLRKRDKVRQLFSSSNPVIFNSKMGKKIKDINTRLDHICDEMQKYSFIPSSEVNTYDHNNSLQQNRLISSFVNESSVIGRDNDKSTIINMLTAVQDSSSKCSIVSIVGMGGLGKTTLARMVYEDDSVRSSFHKMAWVCVSDDFNFKKILMNIIESFTTKKCDDFLNGNVLVDKVRQQLSNQKYLLVLDDLWSEDVQEWNTLQCLLSVGAQGSKVLVTTRSNKVASIVGGAVSPYMLESLSDSDCWSIIKTKAFYLGGGALETPKVICIGENIAKRCGGLPLAANALGNVLRLCKTETEWQTILDHDSLKMSDAKNKIIPILKLSYDKLPSPLKLCFSYCSLFPKDWVIRRKDLVRLWMAEGFLHLSHGASQISLEDVGDDYFHSLLANSFFQDVKLDKLGDVETCKMHDLVHDLAQSVNGVHDIRIEIGETECISKCWRLLLNDNDALYLLEILVEKPKSLRSVSSLRNYFSREIVLEKPRSLRSIFTLRYYHSRNFLLHCKNLRVVYFLKDSNRVFHHPAFCSYFSVFKHKHLRYLDLSHCNFAEGHEVSVNQLYNLQTLVVLGCKNVNAILGGIGSLKLLRHLDLSYSDVKEFDDSFVQLTNLQTLDLSICHKLVALPENIGSLNLRELKLGYCHKVLPREVEKLTRLRCLDLSYAEVHPDSCINNLCNLELLDFGYKFKLPKEIKNLPKLRILKHYRHENSTDEMPRGIETLTALEVLDSYAVRNTSCSGGGSGIEELANLNYLQKLKIHNLEFVRGGIDAERAKLKDKTKLHHLSLNWGSEYHGDEMAFDEMLEDLEPNPNLRELEIWHFPGLKLSKWMGSSNYLPNLVRINFWSCWNCEKLPALGMLPCLKYLYIYGMKSVKYLGEEFYCQREEESTAGSNTIISLFPSLISLSLLYMENLEEWLAPRPTYNFPSLEKLTIQELAKLRSTPKSFSFLKELSFSGFVNSKALSSIFTAGGLTSLTFISIYGSPKLIYVPLGVLLQNITPNLQNLFINKCSEFQGFVQDDDLNNYNNSQDDDDDAILSFSCPEINSNSNNRSNDLRLLRLFDCPALTLLPDLRSFTSLRELTIRECSKLKESVPYDLKTLSFLDALAFDFIQNKYKYPENPAHKSLRIKNRFYDE